MALRPSIAQRARLAQEVRERFVADAGRGMLELGAALQERLTALIQQAAPLPDMHSRRDAWSLYQDKRTTWQEGTLKAWQAALQPAMTRTKKTVQDDSLELLDADVMEDRILASRLVQGVLEKDSAGLNDLRVRIAYLEGTQDLGGQDILHPDVLLLQLIEQWTQAGMPRAAWPLVNEVACKLLTQHLSRAYANGNEFLIRQGVLPTIELKDRIKRGPPSAPRSTSSPGAAGLMPRESGAAPMPGHPAAARRDSGYGNASDETRLMTSMTPFARAGSRALEVLGQLKRLLVGSAEANFETTHHQPPSPALAAAIAARPGFASLNTGRDTLVEDYSPAGVARVAGELRQQSAELKHKAETKSEKATIEIVALMFQSILQEERIPPGIRVWFARLQMPVLRVALAEPEFFGTLTHPARQLIDRMGSCVMGFDASGINGSTLETEIRRVVQVIEQYPETGKQVYQLVYDEFQRFLAQFLSGKASTQKVVSVAQQVEQKETLTIQYTIEMRNMLKDMPVREDIREFLFKVWAEVLALAAVRQGPQHAETLALKKSATDLVWAASAKPQRADRARVIQDLPQLLQRLRAGMTLLGLAPSQQESYVKAISATLADAFLSKTQAIPTEHIQALAQRLAHLEDFVSEDGMGDLPLDAQSIELMLGLEASTIDVVADGGSKPTVAMRAWAQALQLGSWFTLDHNGQVAQVQFVWRSERKHLNLFASAAGHSYLVQTGRLAAYLQAGLLLPQEEEALTVRATRDALVKLEANPERLLG